MENRIAGTFDSMGTLATLAGNHTRARAQEVLLS